MRINDPAVLAELMRLHEQYEQALITNDVAVLETLFWNSTYAIRYGITENLHGAEEISAFRQARPNMDLARRISRLDITALGDAAGIINLEFIRAVNGIERNGRQTQFWCHLPEGWRIISAHVSFLPATPSYPDAAAALIGLNVDPALRPAVSDDLSRIGQIAKFLMEFPLPQEVEPAPVFHP